MSLGFNTLASRRGRRIGLIVSLAACLMACRPAAADELQTLISTSLSSGLIDVSAMDIDAADRALAISRAPMDMQAANGRTFVRPATGSLMADASSMTDSMPSSAIRPAMRRIADGNLAELASSADVSDLLPLSRTAFPLLVGGLTADIPSIKMSSTSLRPLTGPVVGVRSSLLRPGVVASR
jgi:hypothetical protein